ncbi:hypothetical protein [uncultured Duncaniella sp.]|uniref:hypothetical protein n=1 Tax=uncultured Duncaniella sp. TaxID=2768039 RepID=UPI002610712E|nr:hypothetical protein [uncultured Duncaniella sp.]
MDDKTYKHFPYSDEMAAKLNGMCKDTEHMLPAVAAETLTPECVVSKIKESEQKFEFDIHKLASGDTVHVTRWQKDSITPDDISQSIELTELLDKMMQHKLQRTTPMTATMMCAEYREGLIQYREACDKMAEYIAHDLEHGTDLYTAAIKRLFGDVLYTFFRDIALSKHPELMEKIDNPIAQKLLGEDKDDG